MEQFITPAFLENSGTDEIHNTMKEILPDDLDLSQGGHAWNMTRPTALVAAEIRQFIFPEVIKLIFPEYSYGEYLDGHAKARCIIRKAARAATGKLTITGDADSIIPAGSLFSTASVNDEPSVDYRTLTEAIIPKDGSITVDVQCTQAGIVGNTTTNTVVMVASRLTGVTAVTNMDEISGGTEEESDASLINRVLDYDRSQGDNFVGSVADYKRWATSVPGVGDATIIPAQDDSGLVTIVLTDANGVAATQKLCESVYHYIMRPDAPEERPAPVNALLSVVPPYTMDIGIQATVELKGDATVESVKSAFMKQLASYLPEAMEEQEIKHTRIAAALSAASGVNDYSDLQIGVKTNGAINYGSSNIPIDIMQLPEVSETDIILTAGTV